MEEQESSGTTEQDFVLSVSSFDYAVFSCFLLAEKATHKAA